MAQYLLEGRSLNCERDRRVLFHDLNVSVGEGEVLQIEGPNGSGKTSLLRILSGLSDLYEGQVLWRGQSLARVRYEFNRDSQYLGHNPGIKAALSPQENLAWYAAMAGRSAAVDVDAALMQVGLRGYEDVPCYTLSAGQQRRVNLARLLVIPAKLWILDEPFTAIDKSGVALVERVIAEQVADGGSVIVTTHQDLQAIADVRRLSLGVAC